MKGQNCVVGLAANEAEEKFAEVKLIASSKYVVFEIAKKELVTAAGPIDFHVVQLNLLRWVLQTLLFINDVGNAFGNVLCIGATPGRKSLQSRLLFSQRGQDYEGVEIKKKSSDLWSHTLQTGTPFSL